MNQFAPFEGAYYGLIAGRKTKTAKDFLMGGKDMQVCRCVYLFEKKLYNLVQYSLNSLAYYFLFFFFFVSILTYFF